MKGLVAAHDTAYRMSGNPTTRPIAITSGLPVNRQQSCEAAVFMYHSAERGKPGMDIMSIFRGIIVPLMVVIAAAFLLYVRTVEVETVSPKLRRFAIPAAKYVVATFIGTFGAFAVGVVIVTPPAVVLTRCAR